MNQSKLLLLLLLCLTSSLSFGQDMIHFINGEKLEVQIVSETKTEIEVKRYSDLQGNSLLISTKGIHKIIYENGLVNDFNPLDVKEIEKVELQKQGITVYKKKGLQRIKGFWRTSYYNNKELISCYEFKDFLNQQPSDMKKYRSGQRLNILGNIVGIPGGFILGDYLGGLLFGFENTFFGNNRGYDQTLLAAGAISTIVSIVFTLRGNKKMNNAINSYNAKNISLNIDSSDNGIGIVLTF